MLTVTVSSSMYLYFLFRRELATSPELKAIKKLNAEKNLK
jgi:hypothetical protein